jgi:hypothetical protein
MSSTFINCFSRCFVCFIDAVYYFTAWNFWVGSHQFLQLSMEYALTKKNHAIEKWVIISLHWNILGSVKMDKIMNWNSNEWFLNRLNFWESASGISGWRLNGQTANFILKFRHKKWGLRPFSREKPYYVVFLPWQFFQRFFFRCSRTCQMNFNFSCTVRHVVLPL